MKKETNYFEAIVAFGLGITLSIFTTAYKVFALMKIIKWFNIPISLTFEQWFGVTAIIGLISVNWSKADKTDKSIWNKVFTPLLESVFYTSLLLLIYYIVQYFV